MEVRLSQTKKLEILQEVSGRWFKYVMANGALHFEPEIEEGRPLCYGDEGTWLRPAARTRGWNVSGYCTEIEVRDVTLAPPSRVKRLPHPWYEMGKWGALHNMRGHREEFDPRNDLTPRHRRGTLHS